jgi:hypothetical protein
MPYIYGGIFRADLQGRACEIADLQPGFGVEGEKNEKERAQTFRLLVLLPSAGKPDPPSSSKVFDVLS